MLALSREGSAGPSQLIPRIQESTGCGGAGLRRADHTFDKGEFINMGALS